MFQISIYSGRGKHKPEFGAKRIYVKIERGRIQIKVRGANVSIDEFIDQYTPIELNICISTKIPIFTN